ncbi:DUF930 domain-containing protein [Microvirga sp. 2MCAF38]|uniref:DUF930 domain-containing protein n=1 Tax=Microvirga sp. 2MCAF38 TaxID=3232989 RepID=UPI003F96B28E
MDLSFGTQPRNFLIKASDTISCDMKAKGLWASLALHAFMLLTFFIPQSREPIPLFDESVPVEIWTQDRLAEFSGIETPQVSKDAQIPEPSEAEPSLQRKAAPEPISPEPPIEEKPRNRASIRATKILSGDVLSHPLSRKLKAMLPLFGEETRLEQLCGLEAMAQIAALKEFQPDRVVAYAMSDSKITKTSVLADGAAFRSNGTWYNLKFKCGLKAGRQNVESFEFQIGDAIPKSAWEAHNLPARF